MKSSLRKIVPWWARVAGKIALARLPIPYGFWKRLRLFEHGDMNDPDRAMTVFCEHAKTAGVLRTEAGTPRLTEKAKTFCVLELGPGDSLFTAVIAKALGATHTWLVDAGPFATVDMEHYSNLFVYLRQRGFVLPFEREPRRARDVLSDCSAEYLTEGVLSLKRLPSASVDYCFSNAVLEHVPKKEFVHLANELYRVLKPNGVSVHRVDLKDHLGGSLNNLRFSDEVWEGRLFRSSGFYTNRIRFEEMLSLLEEAGFTCALARVSRWSALPTPRSCLATQFQRLSDNDLLTNGFDVVLQRKVGR